MKVVAAQYSSRRLLLIAAIPFIMYSVLVVKVVFQEGLKDAQHHLCAGIVN
jgi:hypothetical protein